MDFVKTFWNLKPWVIIRGLLFHLFYIDIIPVNRYRTKKRIFKDYSSKQLQFLRVTVMSHYVSFMSNAKNIWDHCTPEQFNPGGLQITEPSAQWEFRRLFPFKSHFSHGGAKIWVIIFSYNVLYVPIIRVWNPFCK